MTRDQSQSRVEQAGRWVGVNGSAIRVAYGAFIVMMGVLIGLAGAHFGAVVMVCLGLLMPGLRTPRRLIKSPRWTLRQLWYTLIQKKRVEPSVLGDGLVVMEARPWGWTEVRKRA